MSCVSGFILKSCLAFLLSLMFLSCVNYLCLVVCPNLIVLSCVPLHSCLNSPCLPWSLLFHCLFLVLSLVHDFLLVFFYHSMPCNATPRHSTPRHARVILGSFFVT